MSKFAIIAALLGLAGCAVEADDHEGDCSGEKCDLAGGRHIRAVSACDDAREASSNQSDDGERQALHDYRICLDEANSEAVPGLVDRARSDNGLNPDLKAAFDTFRTSNISFELAWASPGSSRDLPDAQESLSLAHFRYLADHEHTLADLIDQAIGGPRFDLPEFEAYHPQCAAESDASSALWHTRAFTLARCLEGEVDGKWSAVLEAMHENGARSFSLEAATRNYNAYKTALIEVCENLAFSTRGAYPASDLHTELTYFCVSKGHFLSARAIEGATEWSNQ